MRTIRLTMAQALLRFLDQQYISVDGHETKFVRGVMGIFGHGNVTGIGEALEYSAGDLTYIQGKNEQGMVHAATAYAKQKNRQQIYACTTSIGPGALNMVTAAATATVNRIPVLLLPGDNFASRQPDPVLQQLEIVGDYTVSATDPFKSVSKYWDRIVRPEQLISAATQAMRVLTDPAETGAVTLALPQDVQAEAYDYPEAFFDKKIHYIDRRPAAKEAVNRAAALFLEQEAPVDYCRRRRALCGSDERASGICRSVRHSSGRNASREKLVALEPFAACWRDWRDRNTRSEQAGETS